MPPFAAGDASHSLDSFSGGALASMCPNLLFFAPLPLRDKAKHRLRMSALAPRLQASLRSRNSKDSRFTISRRLSLKHLSQLRTRCHQKLVLPPPIVLRRPSQSPSFCQDFSPFQRGPFVTSHSVRLSLEKCRSATDCGVVILADQ